MKSTKCFSPLLTAEVKVMTVNVADGKCSAINRTMIFVIGYLI